MKRLLAFAILAALPLSLDAEDWETIPNCRLIPSDYNDGDSFHVRAAGREIIVRLYFVDAAETDNTFRSRTSDQAKYFGVPKKRIYQLADEATAFTAGKLDGNFTIRTKWEDAKGNSQLPRYFAVVETPEGDLAELLVAAGLARIHGHFMGHPRGVTDRQYRELLEKLQASARSTQRGAWSESSARTAPAKSTTKKSPSPRTPTVGEIPAF